MSQKPKKETVPQLDHASKTHVENGGFREDIAVSGRPDFVNPKRTHIKKKPKPKPKA